MFVVVGRDGSGVRMGWGDVGLGWDGRGVGVGWDGVGWYGVAVGSG